MEIKVIEPYGYCFGIKQALIKLYKLKNEYNNYKIHILGPLIHNKIANDTLINDGFDIFDSVDKENQLKFINSLDKNKDIVIFALHGYYKQVEELLISKEILYFNILCKFVKHNIEEIKDSNKNYFIVGNENHIEIKYLESFLKSGSYIVNDSLKIESDKDYTVLNQTTIDEKSYEENINVLSNFKNLTIKKNLCVEPSIRYLKFEQEIKNNSYDYVFALGDKTSENTNNLLNIYYKTTNLHNIDIFCNISDLSEFNFKNIKKVLVVTGTSIENSRVEAIIDYLKSK